MKVHTINDLNKLQADINGITVELIRGDITQHPVDAVIVPQFSDKVSDGGIALAFHKALGRDICKPYQGYLKAAGGKVEFCQVIANYDEESAKWFFHAVTVKSGRDNAFENTNKAVANALLLACHEGLHSLATPTLGTGTDGELEDRQSALCELNAIFNFGDFKRALGYGRLSVTIVVGGMDAGKRFTAFREVMRDGTYKNATPEVGTRPFDPRKLVRDSMVKPGMQPIVVVDSTGVVLGEAKTSKRPGKVVELFPRKERDVP